MKQNTFIQNSSIFFNDSTLIGQKQVKVLQLEFTLSELKDNNYIEIIIDGTRKSVIVIE